MDDFIPKPIHTGMLRSALERWVTSKFIEGGHHAEQVSAIRTVERF
jgi:ribose 5-phosphate isomerase RpiB